MTNQPNTQNLHETQQAQEIWQTYASSWKAESAEEKRHIFKQCLDPTCTYTDPLTQTQGWDELTQYMLEFHQQVPGGHFETTSFKTHHHQSIATWHMKDAQGNILGDGISHGKYNADGKLIAMTGFFDTPDE